MNTHIFIRNIVLLAGFALFLSQTGCSTGQTPSADDARKGLQTALAAWTDGARPGLIAGTEPPVQAVDAVWQRGRGLASFEILRAQDGESDRRFVVRLEHRDPPRTEEVNYVVIGQG